MPRPKKPETMVTISIRLPPGLVAEIDREAERLRSETPLLAINRTDAIRYLLLRALREPARRKKQT